LCEVTFIEELRPGVFALSFTADELRPPEPGQFLHIKCGHSAARILRRPISTADYFAGGDGICPELTIIFEVRGEGTAWLSRRTKGDKLDVLGPLGRGFAVPDSGDILLAGGGLGIAPLLYIASLYTPRCAAVLGFRSADRIILSGDFDRLCKKITLCTDDGSYGRHGNISLPLAEEIRSGAYSALLACGPAPMLRSVSAAAAEAGIPIQVSLEERMACGVGACLGCAVSIRGEYGEANTSRVCKDGPVFDGKAVIW